MSEQILHFKVSYAKQMIDIEISPEEPITNLKQFLESKTGVPVPMQKLFFKGPIKDDTQPIGSLNIKANAKLMLIGSTASEISATSSARPIAFTEEQKYMIPTDDISAEQRRVIEKGPPSDAIPAATMNTRSPDTIPGLYNHVGHPVRVTIKRDLDQLWVASTTKTQKIPFASISDITSQPILQYPGYLIVTLHFGKTNRANLYFFPAQYFRSFKDSICAFFGESYD
ncbi:UBFD1 [Blepharisma stoltei]|uniref:Ubiquitin-like domain-containing protein n=1 Tax=Blepharisma stoltei TaxID=1481888 RepID=A0AAU9IDC5_9CILI|nr:unnamed protein product [Blepharisma stoltei]